MLDEKAQRKAAAKKAIPIENERDNGLLHERLIINKNGKKKELEIFRSLNLLKQEEGQDCILKRGRQKEKIRSNSKPTRSTETYKEITQIEKILKRGTSKDIITDFTPSELNLSLIHI